MLLHNLFNLFFIMKANSEVIYCLSIGIDKQIKVSLKQAEFPMIT